MSSFTFSKPFSGPDRSLSQASSGPLCLMFDTPALNQQILYTNSISTKYEDE